MQQYDINMEMAKLEGIDLQPKEHRHSSNPDIIGMILIHPNIPDYCHDFEACQRVFKKLDQVQKRNVWERLFCVGKYGPLIAKPKDFCEAILKETERWDMSETKKRIERAKELREQFNR